MRAPPFSLQEWDDELAYAAQFWAAGCEYMLNEDRNDQIQTYDYIGQSNGATISYTVNYTIMIQTWFQQGRLYNYYSGVCLNADGNEDEEGEACFNYINVSSHQTVTMIGLVSELPYNTATDTFQISACMGKELCCWLWSVQMRGASWC